MNYPEFNALSIISVLISVCSIAVICMFVSNMTSRIKRLEKKTVELIKSFSRVHDDVNLNKHAIQKKHENIRYMEGDIDLVREDKRATFKAIYHPRKIRRK